MTSLSSIELKAYLPHRHPFLLIDKVLEIIPKKTIIAIKNLSRKEHCFQGHFPQKPIMPGVLIVEAMAQAAHILLSYTDVVDKNNVEKMPTHYVLAAIKRMQFKRFVLPGDQLKMVVTVKWKRFDFIYCDVTALADNQLVCIGEITVSAQSLITSNSLC